MKTALLVAVVMGVLLIAGCTANQAGDTGEREQRTGAPASDASVETDAVYQVVIDETGMNPVDLEINVRDSVEWLNNDNIRHTISFVEGQVDEILPPGGSVLYTFTRPGEFAYASQFNEQLDDNEDRIVQGTVTVR